MDAPGLNSVIVPEVSVVVVVDSVVPPAVVVVVLEVEDVWAFATATNKAVAQTIPNNALNIIAFLFFELQLAVAEEPRHDRHAPKFSRAGRIGNSCDRYLNIAARISSGCAAGLAPLDDVDLARKFLR